MWVDSHVCHLEFTSLLLEEVSSNTQHSPNQQCKSLDHVSALQLSCISASRTAGCAVKVAHALLLDSATPQQPKNGNQKLMPFVPASQQLQHGHAKSIHICVDCAQGSSIR